eukprot:2881879-Rhodomonas_salina.1
MFSGTDAGCTAPRCLMTLTFRSPLPGTNAGFSTTRCRAADPFQLLTDFSAALDAVQFHPILVRPARPVSTGHGIAIA